MKDKKNCGNQLVEWIIGLNSDITNAATEGERELIITQLKEELRGLIASETRMDNLSFVIILWFEVLPEIVKAANIELHPDIEYCFIEEMYEATKTPEQLLVFCKIMFPMMEHCSLHPLTSDRMLWKLQDVLSTLIMPIVNDGAKNTKQEIAGGLASFLYPYINDALKEPFAQEDLLVTDENGTYPSGKKFHLLFILKEALSKLSLPEAANAEFKN